MMHNKVTLILVLALTCGSVSAFSNTDRDVPEGNSTRDAVLIYAAVGALTVATVLGLSTIFKRSKLKQVLAKYEDAVQSLGDQDVKGSPLFDASSKQEVRSLINAGYKVNVRDDSGLTALFSVQDPDAVRELIKNGADVHARDHTGSTALFSSFNVEKAKELVEAGVDIHVRDNYGEDALSRLAEVSRMLEDEALPQNNRSDSIDRLILRGQVAETIKYLTPLMRDAR